MVGKTEMVNYFRSCFPSSLTTGQWSFQVSGTIKASGPTHLFFCCLRNKIADDLHVGSVVFAVRVHAQ